MIPPATAAAELEASQQGRQLRRAVLNLESRGLRPDERPFLEALGEKPESGFLPHQDFQTIPAAVAENKQAAR